MVKVAVLGIGNVGKFLCRALSMSNIANKIYPFSTTGRNLAELGKELGKPGHIVLKDNLENILNEADIAVIAASREDRQTLPIERKRFAKANLPFIQEIGNRFKGYEGNVLIITNPVDEATFAFQKASAMDANKVVGLNHTDALRFNYIVQEYFESINEDIPLEKIRGCLTFGPHNGFVQALSSKLRIEGKPKIDIFKLIPNINNQIASYGLKLANGLKTTGFTTISAACEVIKAMRDATLEVSVSVSYKGIAIGQPVRFVHGKATPSINIDRDISKEQFAQFWLGYLDIVDSLIEQNILTNSPLEKQPPFSKSKPQLESILIQPNKKKIMGKFPPRPIKRNKDPLSTIPRADKYILTSRNADSETQVDRYILEEQISGGVHGDVFHCRLLGSNIPLAIKKGNCKHLLEAEAKRHSRLSFPNIIGYKGFFQTEKHGYIVMEYAPSPFPCGKINDLGLMMNRTIELFAGIDYIHRRGLMHLDIRPENLLIGIDQRIKIIDFGSSYKIDDDSVTPGRMALGEFTAPEVLNGILTRKVDIYSAGAIIFEMFTGVTYSPSNTPRISALNSLVPPELEEVIYRCLDEDKDNRPSATEVISIALKCEETERARIALRLQDREEARRQCELKYKLLMLGREMTYSEPQKAKEYFIEVLGMGFNNESTINYLTNEIKRIDEALKIKGI
ncbi:MAG: protein kinase [Nanoarchaeota archaeon]|nr:protein kinase [Nanoarchaeota archaeon]